jgi:hypothetical protein
MGGSKSGPEWRMEVLDEQQRMLFIIRFSAEIGPAFRSG